MGDTLKNSTAAVLAATENLVSVDTKNEAAMFAALSALADTGVSVADISKGGSALAAFQAGVLVGWQGAEFAEAFASAKSGKAPIKGKIRDRTTRRMISAELAKVEWQRQLSSKVSKYRAIVAEYIGDNGPDNGSDNGSGKGKAGKRGSRAGSKPRNLSAMMADTVADWAKRLDAVASGTAKPASDAEAFTGDIAPVRDALKALTKALKEAK